MRKLFYFYLAFIHILLGYLLIKITTLLLPKQEQELNSVSSQAAVGDCQNRTGESPSPENKSFNRVTVLPHPPDFLVGREILFQSYRTAVEEGKKKVIFKEFKNGRFIETKVDSEAIQWK